MSLPTPTALRLSAMALSAALTWPLAALAEVPAPSKQPLPQLQPAFAGKASTATTTNTAAPAKDASQKQSAPAGLPTAGSSKVPATGNTAADEARKAATVGAPGSGATTASGALAGTASSQLRQNAATIPGTISGVPAFNQGFQNNSAAVQQLQGGGSLSGNPVSGLTGGGSAGSSTGALTGVAAQGKGAISDSGKSSGNAGTGVVIEGVTVLTQGSPSTTTDPNRPKVQNPFEGDADVSKNLKGDVEGRQDQMDSALCDSGDQAACDRRKQRSSGDGAKTEGSTTTASTTTSKENFTKDDDGTIIHTHADGSVTKIVDNKDGTTTVTHYDAAGKKTEEKVPSPKGSQCNSEDCNRGAADREKFLASNPAIAAQLGQAKSGGSGEVDPGRGDATAFVGGVGALPSATVVQQNLVGQPGQAGGLQEHGVVQTGFNFNNKNVGAVDPGPEGTVTAGNREDGRVADAIGGGPSRELPTQSCDADGRTADPADDCKKP